MTAGEWNTWHADLQGDVEARDPWHELVKRHLHATDMCRKRVLEIGCGRGGFACWLAGQHRDCEIVAADYSEVAVAKGRELARRLNIDRVTWKCADIESLDYESETFDTVVSCETIEHVIHPARAVRELARVLRPGGRLFLTTPNYIGPLGVYRAYLRLVGRRFTEVGQPINQLTMIPRTLRWTKAAGLEVQLVDGVGHYAPWPGRPPVRLRLLDRTPLRWFALHSLIVAIKVH